MRLKNDKTRPLVREGAPQRQDSNFHTATLGQEVISGHKPHWLTNRDFYFDAVRSNYTLGRGCAKSI
jgi:hypothetical protein